HRVAAQEERPGAAARGLGRETVAVEARPLERDVEAVGLERARVGADAPQQAGGVAAQALGAGGIGGLAQAHADHGSSSRTTWRSSKGKTSSPMIWVVSWPLPAISTTSPGRAARSARRMASRRSTSTRTSARAPSAGLAVRTAQADPFSAPPDA